MVMSNNTTTQTDQTLIMAPRPGRFRQILVPLSGRQLDWRAMDQALIMAKHEHSRLHGLHVVPSLVELEDHYTRAIQMEFDRRCQKEQVPGGLMVEIGSVEKKVCERARWADLVVMSASHPPGRQPLARLKSRFGELVRCCSTPILAVSGPATPCEQILVAYDGSPKAKDALAIAASLNRSTQRRLALIIVTVVNNHDITTKTLVEASQYLSQYRIEANFIKAKGAAAGTILGLADEYEADLIVMGSYGLGPVWEIILGSTVDQVLRGSTRPVLICP